MRDRALAAANAAFRDAQLRYSCHWLLSWRVIEWLSRGVTR